MTAGRRRTLPRVAASFTITALAGGCALLSSPRAPAPDPGPPSGDGVASPFGEQKPLVTPPAGDRSPRAEAAAPEPAEEEEALPLRPDRPWEWRPELEEGVAFWIDLLREARREEITRWLGRAGRYEPFVRARLEAKGLPEELFYLPLIESGYHPEATSRAGAVGMWQFMSSTARRHGLTVTALVDERRDPFAATDAALDYLGDLVDRFDGSLLLALAAYNSGENRIERLLRRHRPDAPPDDSLYWAIRDRLPRETRNYVPKFVAAVRIGEDPEAHGFGPLEEEPAFEHDAVTVRDAASIDVLAAAAGVDEARLGELNPHLRRGLTPAGRRTTLRLPPGTGDAFEEAFARIPASERVTFVEHVVRRGDTVSEIAAAYGVRLVELMAANEGVRPRRLLPGQRLIIPKGGSGSRSSVLARVERKAGETRTVEHRVRRGESLWEIARGYGVSVADLRRWNDLERRSLIRPGERLRVEAPSLVVYRVQRGDTLSEIAARHGVSTRELARFNGLRLSDLIRPGDRVRIPVGGS